MNFSESIFESLLVLIAGTVTVIMTRKLLSKIEYLEGFLSICSACKKIRDEQGDWIEPEVYVRDHSQAEFSHGICPECASQLYPGVKLHTRH
ncbi:MAG: hypothetical protein ABIA75_13420 [Candidatus Neomarinimicrobiota bacterium]